MQLMLRRMLGLGGGLEGEPPEVWFATGGESGLLVSLRLIAPILCPICCSILQYQDCR